MKLLLKAHNHCATENGHSLSELKVVLPVDTHGLLTCDINAKKLIKQEAPYQSTGCSTAAAILALTETGFSSLLISKYRPDCPILAITSSSVDAHRLALSWGIYSTLYTEGGSDADKVAFALQAAKRIGQVETGDLVILAAGSSRQARRTNLIRVVVVD